MKIYIMSLFLWCGLLQAEGVGVDTLISTQQGLISIQSIVVGDSMIDGYCVFRVTERIVSCCVEIKIGDFVVCAAPDQRFYIVNGQKWVNAGDLIVSDKLLCRGGETVDVEEVNIISK